MITIIIIVFGITLAALAGAGWLLYRREYQRRWQEISIVAGLQEDLRKTTNEKDKLQYMLSSALCPANNHIWQDGRCTRCGRAYDLQS